MICVTVEKKQNSYIRFESRGHAGYRKAGQDIVCAGVSALIITIANALETFTDDAYTLEQKDGYVAWEFKKRTGPAGTLLMDALLLGLQDIQNNYDHKYLQIIIREVDRHDGDEPSVIRS